MAKIQPVTPDDFVLLQGDDWIGNKNKSTMHRSPAIEAQGSFKAAIYLAKRQ